MYYKNSRIPQQKYRELLPDKWKQKNIAQG